MDKVKQNIIQQQQLDKFNIEKSVIGTEAYYINQDIQKGISGDEIIEKAKSGVYKLTAENKKAGRVGQKYGESKKEDEKIGDFKKGDKVNWTDYQLSSDNKIEGVIDGKKDEKGRYLINFKDGSHAYIFPDVIEKVKESTDKKEDMPKRGEKFKIDWDGPSVVEVMATSENGAISDRLNLKDGEIQLRKYGNFGGKFRQIPGSKGSLVVTKEEFNKMKL